MSEVFVVSVSDECSYVVLVADSLESALEQLKHEYAAPYIVTWNEFQQSGDGWLIHGAFEAVPGKSTKHSAWFEIDRFEVRSANPPSQPDDHTREHGAEQSQGIDRPSGPERDHA